MPIKEYWEDGGCFRIMKIFGYLDDLMGWMFGLAWYWQVILWILFLYCIEKNLCYRGDL